MNFIFNISLGIIFIVTLFSAVPANTQDIQEKQVEIIRFSDRPWMGVQVSDLTRELVEDRELPRDEGVYVNEVIGDSPAETAGIQTGDIIIRFNNREIYDAEGLVRAVEKSTIDEPVDVIIIRDGREHNLTVTLREHPRSRAVRIPRPPDTPRIMMAHRHGRLGVSVIDLNPQLGEYFKVPGGKGVLVEKVHAHTPAEEAGVRAGDVIVKVDDRTIETARELRRTLSQYEAAEDVRIEIIREGTRKTLTVRIEEQEFSEFFIPDFDKEEFEIGIFGPGGAEEFRRKLEESIRPGLEDFKIQMEQFRDHMKDFKVEFPASRTI